MGLIKIPEETAFSAPNDVRRYFVTQQESGELCLLSGLLGENRDIFFPKLIEKLHLVTFSEIAKSYLKERGYKPYECQSEKEARDRAEELIAKSVGRVTSLQVTQLVRRILRSFLPTKKI